MKYFIIAIFTVLIIDPGKIARVNTAKTEARKAYMDGDYKKAVAKYTYLADSLDVREDEVMLNLANSYFQVKDTANAASTYQSLTASAKSHIRSKANHQLGILNHQQGKLEEALNNFKQAIKADANNIDAKYNYEMLKKKLDEKKKEEEQKQNKDQKDKDQKNKDPQNKDQQKKDQENKDQQQKEKDKKNKKRRINKTRISKIKINRIRPRKTKKRKKQKTRRKAKNKINAKTKKIKVRRKTTLLSFPKNYSR